MWRCSFFLKFLKWWRSKENEIVEPWKFSLKMGVGDWGWWANSFFLLSVVVRTFVYLSYIYIYMRMANKYMHAYGQQIKTNYLKHHQ